MKTSIKYCLLLTFILGISYCDCASAQEDTLLLPLFEKQAETIDQNTGTYLADFDSITFQRYQSSDLADLLRNESFVNIRSNSPGNLATLSYRGLSGVHTFIDWNGLNLNSPSAGLTDLSTINLGGFDDVSFKSDEQNGSRLSLVNNLSDQPFEFKAGGRLSSFEGYYGRATYNYGIADLALKTHVDYEQRANDYPFRNDQVMGPLLQYREQSRFEGLNVHQDIVLKQSHRGMENTYGAHIWYSKYARQLPGSIAFLPSNQLQDDRSLRVALKTEMHDGAFSWNNTLGYISDYLFYDFGSPFFEFFQEIRTNRWHLNSTFKFDLKEYLASSGLELRSVAIENTNYTNPSDETAVAVWAQGQKNWENSKVTLHLRQEFSNVFKIPFTGSLGLDKYHENNKLWASVKRIGRAPVFDDFFWTGSANPNLDPEVGWAFEGGWALLNEKTGKEELAISIYRNNMTNWIQWIPDTNFIFTPTNYKSVTINGFTLNWDKEYGQLNTAIITRASISYNNAVNNVVDFDNQIENKSIIYSPDWKGVATLGIREGNTSIGYRFEYVDDQFTDELNTNELEAASIHNLFLFSQISPKVSLNLELRNLTNRSYQSIQDYPMYGLNYKVELQYKINSSIRANQSSAQKVKKSVFKN